MVDAPFRWPIRIYWEDTDAGGVVYHASYLRFLERARSEYLRHLGIEQERLRNDNNLVFVVRDIAIGFIKPARLDDVLDVTVALTERRPASLVFQQQILRAADGRLLSEARVRAVGRGATAPREGTANPASRRHRRVEVVIETPRRE